MYIKHIVHMLINTFIFILIFSNGYFYVQSVSSQSNISPFGVSMRNTVMSGVQDTADFAINIHPPNQDVTETLKSLDGIMLMENAQRLADNEDFTDSEQRLLKVHKNKIREIVATAFEPIHSMFPSNAEGILRNDDTL